MSSPVRRLGAETPMKTPAPAIASLSVPVTPLVGALGEPDQVLGPFVDDVLAGAVDHTANVGDHDVGGTGRINGLRIAVPAAPGPAASGRP
jgi:hypothetical protein